MSHLRQTSGCNGLPICVHFGGEGAGFAAPPTAAGVPHLLSGMRMARPQIAMAHTASLICEGVFEKFPNFKFLFVELDIFWVPGLIGTWTPTGRACATTRLGSSGCPASIPRAHPLRFPALPQRARPQVAGYVPGLAPADEVNASDYPHWDWEEPRGFMRGLDKKMRAT